MDKPILEGAIQIRDKSILYTAVAVERVGVREVHHTPGTLGCNRHIRRSLAENTKGTFFSLQRRMVRVCRSSIESIPVLDYCKFAINTPGEGCECLRAKSSVQYRAPPLCNKVFRGALLTE